MCIKIDMKQWVKLNVLLLCLLSFSSTYAWRELTITKTDSLASIAGKYHPEYVTRMDMVIAIRNANPHVFAKASNFKPGVKLLLPTTQAEVRQAIKGKAPTPNKTVANPAPVAKVATLASAPPKPAPTTKAVSQPVLKTDAIQKAVASVKKITAGVSGAATQNATLVKSLQDTVSNQTEMIQSYQAEINQLNAELNLANQQVQSLQASSGSSLWTLSNLWLTLWILTLGGVVWYYRKYKALLAADSEGYEEDEELVAVPTDDHSLDEEPQLADEDKDESEDEEIEDDGQEDEVAIVDEREEPQLTLIEEGEPKSLSANWEQVELDIPIEDVSSELGRADNAQSFNFDKYSDNELAESGQDDIIEALSQDENNMEWHQALLEFYVKTNSQSGFKRHYQNMVKNGLMTEGDPLWEDVRKMYLNKWIYQAL